MFKNWQIIPYIIINNYVFNNTAEKRLRTR